MKVLTKTFAIYSKEDAIRLVVDELLASGFAKSTISVLHPDNDKTREFAEKKGTHPPKGTDQGRYANVPLAGTWGIRDPGEGPLQGALHDALIEMGVPSDWCDRRVVHGKHLISVVCDNREEIYKTLGLFQYTGACDVSWSELRRANAEVA
jgi:hypothetical protein